MLWSSHTHRLFTEYTPAQGDKENSDKTLERSKVGPGALAMRAREAIIDVVEPSGNRVIGPLLMDVACMRIPAQGHKTCPRGNSPMNQMVVYRENQSKRGELFI